MAHQQLTLNNVNQKKDEMQVWEYNSLPLVDEANLTAKSYAAAHLVLLKLISAEHLQNVFSVTIIHRIHKLSLGQIVVHGTVRESDDSSFVTCRPIRIGSSQVRGLHFLASSNGTMRAYEYTIDAGDDLEQYASFMCRFANTLVHLQVETVFGLTANPIKTNIPTDFETRNMVLIQCDRLSTWAREIANEEDIRIAEQILRYGITNVTDTDIPMRDLLHPRFVEVDSQGQPTEAFGQ